MEIYEPEMIPGIISVVAIPVASVVAPTSSPGIPMDHLILHEGQL